ncbi:MAG TPA: hypothetical protein VMG10_24405 [Gemmataceae bacterium]|nr:hypothetical protein [Gemmataceae bacterium]
MSDGSMRRSVHLRSCSVVGAAVLLLLTFTLAWYRFLNLPRSFNSDHLYCLHFCDDLIHGRDLRGWHLPAAPYLFPDILLLCAMRLLTSDVAGVFLLYSSLYYLLLFAVLWAIFRQVGLSRGEAFPTAALGLTLLLAACFHPDYGVRCLLLMYPGNHMGCLLVGLGVAALVLRTLQRGFHWLSAMLLVLAAGLGGFSDQLLIVQLLVPIGSTVALLALCRLVSRRRAVGTTFLLALAAVGAMSKQMVLTWLGLVPMHLQPALRKPGIDALKQLAVTFWAAFHNQPLMLTVFVLHMAAALTVSLLWMRRCRCSIGVEADPEGADRDARRNGPAIVFVALVLLLAPLSNAGALMIANMVSCSTLDRYLYTWLLLPFLFIALWPRLLPWRATARLAPAAVIGVVLVRLFTFPDAVFLDRFSLRYPPLARALDDMVRKHGRLRGFGHYWSAREMHYLTCEHVEVLPTLPWGQPWFHGYNPNAFLLDDRRDPTVPDYHFAIVPTSGNTEVDAEQILARFGKPAEIIAAGEYEIWRYDRMVNRHLDLFLRTQAAQRLVEQKPFVRPYQPAILAHPKRNLTSWNARGNVQLQRDATLTIRFEKPVAGRMIDIAANYADEYLLWFYREGRKLGKTRVSAVAWNGAEIAYCEPGLQSRLVEVPEACRPDGFDEVRVTPLGRSQHFAIGHFLVFDEWIPYRSGRANPGDRYHRYEGERMSQIDSAEVATVADASASAGQARQATAAFQGYLAYGPYLPLPAGRYRIDFSLKIEDNSFAETIATIDASAFGGWQTLQARRLRGCDFTSANQYQIFSLTFDVAEELDLVEYRVLVGGKTKATFDYVDVTRLPPERTSETCEP